ncbi:MAG: diguanylate cyclase [Pseudomonadota bacterium]|nr:diguanylate cyclase [Pseudomonadota bacterium]
MLFDICNHLNLGSELITDAEERQRLQELNYAAGKKAKAATAYQAAANHQEMAIRLLPADAWEQRRQQARACYLEACEAAYLCKNYQRMEQLIEWVSPRLPDLLDRVAFYEVQVSALVAQGKLKESLALAKPLMARLGHRYPANPGKLNVLVEMFKTLWALRRVKKEDIAGLPLMDDPRHLAAHTLGVRISTAAIFAEQPLLPMLVLRSVRIQLQHGICELGLASWSVVGMILASRLGKAKRGHMFGQIAIEQARRIGSRYAEARTLHVHKFCANLLGEASRPSLLQGEYYDIHKRRNFHEASGDKSFVVVDHLLNLTLLYLFGETEAALTEANAISVEEADVGGFYFVSRLYTMDALTRLANAAGCKGRKRKRLLRRVVASERQLQQWSKHCPENYFNKYCLVKAERLRVTGEDFAAQQWFDLAVEHSAKQGFIQDQALALELCGLMHMNAGRQTMAEPYLAKAINGYRQWGAAAKVDVMLQRFPQLEHQVHSGSEKSFGTTRTEQLMNVDITALMRSLKAIAEENSPGSMISLILQAALQFAGARSAILALRQTTGELRVEGEASPEQERSLTMQSQPMAESRIPEPVVNYVVRTHSSVVIHDASQPDNLIAGLHKDPVVQAEKLRSVLCLPVLIGSEAERELIGLLYLENSLATGTFTRERLDTLEIIAMAAAGRLELSRKASFDGLTGLSNHEYFQNQLKQEYARALRYNDELAVVLMDIDHFKQFNDTWGRQVGDLVLREVAQTIRSQVRECDLVARYGGEEMAIIMPSTPMPDAREVAERIRRQIETLVVESDSQPLNVTISIGVAMLDRLTESKDDLIKRADDALYQSKREGRNRVTAYSRRDGDELSRVAPG